MSERDRDELEPRDVPILAELEVEFRALVVDAYAPARLRPLAAAPPSPAVAPPAVAPRAPRRLSFATGRRILRRGALAGALAGAVGATALATRSIVGHDPAAATIVLERAGGNELTLRRYRGRLCLDITDADGVASRCAGTPSASAVVPLSAATAGARVVAGLAGADVTSVRVQIGTRRRDAVTRAAGGPGAARDLRWFSVAFPAVQRGRAAAATVTPLPAGDAVADCSLGGVASCLAARGRAESGSALERSP